MISIMASSFIMSLLFSLVEMDFSVGLLKKLDRNPKPSGYGNRPRGVPYIRGPFYATGEIFVCANNSKEIPFSHVNDDYCDCADGSDEPGTSACPNGKFHCLNRGYQAIDIPSSRVNDQICDCCDGSDEWDSPIDCPNLCNELGAKYREEMRQKTELIRKGFVKRIELVAVGQQMKAEKLKILEELRKEMEEVTKLRTEAEAKMNEKSDLAKEAREKHDEAWEEERKKLKREYAQMLFTTFDSNNDGKIIHEELKAVSEFDANKDGTVSDDEIKFVIPDGKKECEFEVFLERIYDNIRHLFEDEKKEEKTENEDVGNQIETQVETPEIDSALPKNSMNDAEDKPEQSESKSVSTKIPRIPNIELNKPGFSEETKAVLEEAENARKEFDEIEKRYGNLELSIKDAELYAGGDFGIDMGWASLKGKCVEMDENEYTYKLCLFDKATQKSKNSGIEIDLGKWKGWTGEEPNKYTVQKYDNGTPCWNGPDRSTKVIIECGEETELIETSEPSKCEYLFTLRTPAACPDPASLDEQHDEF